MPKQVLDILKVYSGFKPVHGTAVAEYMRVHFLREQLWFSNSGGLSILVENVGNPCACQFFLMTVAEQRLIFQAGTVPLFILQVQPQYC